MRKTDILKTSIFSQIFIFRSVFGEFRLMQVLNFKTFCCKLKIKGMEGKLCVAFPLFWFWKESWGVKFKASSLFVEKTSNFSENETESKMENLPYTFRETNLCFSSYKNSSLKIKLWWIGARKREKKAFFLRFVFHMDILLSFWFYLNG